VRLNTRRGEENPHALFSNEQAKALRERAREEDLSARALAREQGCSRKTIDRILNRETYR
jgi:DNA invertase Pin-like site-specific DNA recombinase